MNWRWKSRNTISVGVRISERSGAQQRDVGRVVALERAQRAGHGPLRRVLDEHQREQELVPRPDGHAGCPSDAIAGPASGTWMRQKRSRFPAPSTRAASEISVGMFTKCARIQNTANGMYRPMSGRTIASRVFRIPSCRGRGSRAG